MSEVKRIDIKEFREKGYLQEANRLFFHPLGLALEVIVDESDGSESLGGVWDYRGAPEGMVYGPEMLDSQSAQDKINHVEELRQSHVAKRTKMFGGSVQKPNT